MAKQLIIGWLMTSFLSSNCLAKHWKDELAKEANANNWKILYNTSCGGYLGGYAKELKLDGSIRDVPVNIRETQLTKIQASDKIRVRCQKSADSNSFTGVTVQFIDLQEGKIRKEIPVDANYEYVELMASAPDKSEIIIALPSNRYVRIDTLTSVVTPFSFEGISVLEISYSTDKTKLLLWDECHDIYIYDLTTNRPKLIDHGYYPKWNYDYTAVVYAKGSRLIEKERDGIFEIDVKTLQIKQVPFYPIAYSPDRSYYVHHRMRWFDLHCPEYVDVYVSPSKTDKTKAEIHVGYIPFTPYFYWVAFGK